MTPRARAASKARRLCARSKGDTARPEARLRSVAQELDPREPVSQARRPDQGLDRRQEPVVLALQARNRLAKRGRSTAVEVILALPAQQHQHELAARKPFRSACKPVDAQVLTGQEQRFAREDAFQNPNRLEAILLGDLNVASPVHDLGLGHVDEPHRQDQFGLRDRRLEIEHVGSVDQRCQSPGCRGRRFEQVVFERNLRPALSFGAKWGIQD